MMTRTLALILLAASLCLVACQPKNEQMKIQGDPNAPQVVIPDQQSGNAGSTAQPVDAGA